MRTRNLVIGITAALLVGAPAVAYAAGSTFTAFTGQAAFADSAVSAKLLTVANRPAAATGGLNCSSVKITGDATFQINPVAQRATRDGILDVVPGTCDVAIKLKNTGANAFTPATRLTQQPGGWTFTVVDPRPILKGKDGTFVLRVAVRPGAAAGPLAGILTDGPTSERLPPTPQPTPVPPPDPAPAPAPLTKPAPVPDPPTEPASESSYPQPDPGPPSAPVPDPPIAAA